MMQRIAIILVAGLLFGAAGLVAQDAKDAKKDTDKVQGTWQVTSLIRNGETAPKEEAEKAKLIIKGDKFTFKASDGDHEGSFKLDAATDPKNIEIIPSGGGEFKGIYAVSDTELKMCISFGGDRPKAFEAKADSGCFLIVCKKDKS